MLTPRLDHIIHRASRPHVGLLGRISGTGRFSDRQRHPDNELIPGVVIVRPESGLVYFNIDHVRDLILAHACESAEPPQLVVLDLSAAPYVDLQSAHALAELADELTAMGVRVQAVEARSAVRDRLRREGVDGKPGGVGRRNSVYEVTIRAITERVSPRVFRVAALPAPSDREKSQMSMQRYMAHFPAAGEIVIFDRSW